MSIDVFNLLAIRGPTHSEDMLGIEPGSSNPQSSPLPLPHRGRPSQNAMTYKMIHASPLQSFIIFPWRKLYACFWSKAQKLLPCIVILICMHIYMSLSIARAKGWPSFYFLRTTKTWCKLSGKFNFWLFHTEIPWLRGSLTTIFLRHEE